jgi:prolyl-tRNA editing enzyme YbaK/EbsC (Cys-tRNA(Pro) deacylase)
VSRVRQALRSAGFEAQVVELPSSTRTALEAAESIGCEVAQIIKSLVFVGLESGRPILVLASGVNRVDEGILARLAGEAVAKADAGFVRTRTGFAIGGVPPLGHIEPMETFVDMDLTRHEYLWAAAGTPRTVFRLASSNLLAMTGGRAVSVA